MSAPPFDLARLSDWFGVRPRMARSEVLEIWRGHPGWKMETAKGEFLTARADHKEIQLCFTRDGTDQVRQLSFSGQEWSWNGQPLQGATLDEALQAMEPFGPAMWTAGHIIDDPAEPPEEPLSDDELLSHGTLWLAERRLGLAVHQGLVVGVAWREAQDFPRVYAGSLNPEQRALSRRSDLPQYLEESRGERLSRRKDPLATWRKFVTALALAALAAVVFLGLRETERWNQAPTLQSQVVAFEQVPQELLRDDLPPAFRWLIPKSAPWIVPGFRLAYTDPEGRRQELLIEERKAYWSQHEIGEEVPLAWVPGPPPEVRTLEMARDAGLSRFIPWVVIGGILYGLALFVPWLVLALWQAWRRRRRAAARPPEHRSARKKRRKGRMAGGAGWVVSRTVPNPVMPWNAKIRLLECTDDLLLAQTPNALWWPGPCLFALLIAFILYNRDSVIADFQTDLPHALGQCMVVSVITIAIFGMTAFLSTHQRLRVAEEGVDYQLRLGPRILRQRQAPLNGLIEVALDDFSSDESYSACLRLKTKHWEAHYGSETNSQVIQYLIWKINKLQARFGPPPLPSE